MSTFQLNLVNVRLRNKSQAVGGMQSTEVSHVVAAVNILLCATLSWRHLVVNIGMSVQSVYSSKTNECAISINKY